MIDINNFQHRVCADKGERARDVVQNIKDLMISEELINLKPRVGLWMWNARRGVLVHNGLLILL